MKSFKEYREEDNGEETISESNASARYSVEVNFRTGMHEVLESYAKICLGYVSAAMKQYGFHVKQVYEQHPIRVLVSSRNWDDGEWVGVVSWHASRKCYIISKGFYMRDRKTVQVQSSHLCSGDSASDITKELRNIMEEFKGIKDRHAEKLKPVPLKRGPKK